MERRVLDLKVYCKYKSRGCTWSGELCNLEKHVKTCDMSNIELIAERQAQRIKGLEKWIAIIEKENKNLQKINTDNAIKHKHELEHSQLMHSQRVDEILEHQAQEMKTLEEEARKLQDQLAGLTHQETAMKKSIQTLKAENEQLKCERHININYYN